jgi:uncharacterized membrane protein
MFALTPVALSGIELLMTSTTQKLNNHSFDKQPGDTWIKLFLWIYGLWVILPFLAPILMQTGWVVQAKALYNLYSFFCHQLPQRSLFLFGQKSMYSLAEVQAAWRNTVDPSVLSQFIGDPAMGWKIAWSDRMISFYGGVWLFGLLWLPFRKRVKQVSWRGFILLLLPIVVDGIAHMVSDLAGIGNGFRDTNMWLVSLTNNFFPAYFYAGDAFGSFNSWMRWITGLLAGLGLVWLTFPSIDSAFEAVKLARKL